MSWLFMLLFLLKAGGSPAYAQKHVPDEVKIGAYVNDIHFLDLKNHNFSADIYIWFRWKDPKINPAETFEYMNPYELAMHTTKANYDKPVKMADGSLYQVIRTHGRFSKKFILDNYPFDQQELTIGIEDAAAENELMKYVVDKNPISINPRLRLPGFEIGQPRLDIQAGFYPTNFGDSRLDSPTSRFSRITIHIPIFRPVITYAIKFLLPILCVIFCAALMFVFNPNYVDARVGIGITALLTIVALQITLNADLPEVDYLVLIDKIYLCAYMYVIGGLAVVVKTTWMLEKNPDDMSAAIRLDWMSLVILTAIYFAVTACFVYPIFFP